MALPQQLPLEFGATPAPTIGNFVATGNEEAVLRLSGLVAELAVGRAADRLVYLWGESGSGRSHLLHAVCAQAEAAGFQARYLEAKAPLEAFEYDPPSPSGPSTTPSGWTNGHRWRRSTWSTKCARIRMPR